MSSSDKHQKIRALLDLILDGEATETEHRQLALLLKGNPEGQAFYAEYIEMHMHLQSCCDNHHEFIYRRLSEEFIVRPKHAFDAHTASLASSPRNNNGLQLNYANINDINAQLSDLSSLSAKARSWLKFFIVFLHILTLTLVIIGWQFVERKQNHVAEILTGQVSILEIGTIDSNLLAVGEYKVEQNTELELFNGTVIKLVANSIIKIFNANEILLSQGKLTIQSPSQQALLVHTENFTLHSKASELMLDLTTKRPVINAGRNTILIPAIWRPNHFWSFDGHSERAIDSAGNADGITASDTKRVSGLLGAGAFQFINTLNSRINVGNGGGKTPGSGSFAVRDGISIEALISPKFLASLGEEDMIFRKAQGDADLRVQLSLSHDEGKTYVKPEGEFGPSLLFGLYILGQNYEELKLPLDGKNGRPTVDQLNNGKPYHVVATFNVHSGLKAIYLNGQRLASYQYPAGSQALTGGNGVANIGHNPNTYSRENKAFNGVIDEVAFYDFALPPLTIKLHYQQVQNQRNYFGLFPTTEPLPKKIKISLPENVRLELEPLTGLPYQQLGN